MPELDDYFQEKRILTELVEHPGWKRLDAALAELVRVKNIGDRNHRITTLDDAFSKASAEGEIAGIQLARSYLGIMLEDVQANINVLLEIAREEKEDDSKRDAGS